MIRGARLRGILDKVAPSSGDAPATPESSEAPDAAERALAHPDVNSSVHIPPMHGYPPQQAPMSAQIQSAFSEKGSEQSA